jgi:hypothetical protein
MDSLVQEMSYFTLGKPDEKKEEQPQVLNFRKLRLPLASGEQKDQ